MQEDHYRAIAELWHQLKNGVYVELLPYHAYGGSKMTAFNRSFDSVLFAYAEKRKGFFRLHQRFPAG